MALTTSLTLSLTATLTAAADIGTPEHRIPVTFSDDLATGTGADQADQVWADTRTLGATTSEDLDLSGTLTNGLGQTVTFARIKGIYIRNKSTTAGAVLAVGGHATSAFVNWVANATDIINIRNGGVLFLWAPDATAYAVTASTGDILKINNTSAASMDYDIVIIGATA